MQRPILHLDLALDYVNITDLTRKDNWDNGRKESFFAPTADESEFYSYDPNDSPESCNLACEAMPECMQWNFHMRKCKLRKKMVFGWPRDPEEGPDDEEWEVKDEEFVSGWMQEKIGKWVEERACDDASQRWVRPSLDRIP